MSLVSRDAKTGAIVEARKKSDLEAFAVPFGDDDAAGDDRDGVVRARCWARIADDKTQRVFEMLLGSATPFELMAGKVIGAIGLALTSSAFYVTARTVGAPDYGGYGACARKPAAVVRGLPGGGRDGAERARDGARRRLQQPA